jgi:hypothetical protein
VIDFGAVPSIPLGWSIRPEDQLKLRVRGEMKFDPTKVRLRVHPSQKRGIKGYDLKKKIADQPVYGAQLLELYFANPHLIPDEFEDETVFFWGTIYNDPDGKQCVRYLYKHGLSCASDYYSLDNKWNLDCPSAQFTNLHLVH